MEVLVEVDCSILVLKLKELLAFILPFSLLEEEK